MAGIAHLRTDSPSTILYINSVPVIGGAEASLIELASHLNRERYNPFLLTTAPGPLADAFDQINVLIFFQSFPFFSRKRPWVFWGEIAEITRLIRRHCIRLIHVNCDRAVPHAVLAARLTRTPVLCHIHDMTRAWFLPRYVRYLNRSQRIIADSNATAEHCIQAGMDPRKLSVIYECVETEKYFKVGKPERHKVRLELGIGEDKLAIGLVGHVLRYKGHEEFVRAAAVVAAQCPEAKFIIVGDDRMSDEPNFMPYLKTLAHELGISDRLLFIGFRSDVPDIMAAMDLVVVPSWKEPFGRVVVEALATSRPVVGTNVGGIPEIVQHENTGLLVPPRDVEQLAGAITRLARDAELRALMGCRGPESVKKFDVEQHALLFDEQYRALIRRDVLI